MKYLGKLTFALITLCLQYFSMDLHAELDDSSWEQYRQAAKLFQQGDRSEQLIMTCERLRDRNEDALLHARTSLLLAQILAERLSYSEAHKVLKDLYSRKQDIPAAIQEEARLRDARILLQEAGPEAALGLLRTVAATGTSVFLRQEGRIALAGYHADMHNWQSVDSLLSQILDERMAYVNDERVLVIRARSSIAHNMLDAAVNLLIDSNDKVALKYLANAYELNGQPMMAVAVFKKIHDLHANTPEAEEALFSAGEVFMRSEDWLAARTQYNLLLERFPQTNYRSRVYYRLGWLHLNLNQPNEALSAFRNGGSSERTAHFSYMEAQCLELLGRENPTRLQEAILKYNSLVALQPDSPLAPKAYLKAAFAMLETGATQDAAVSLRQFLALYPKHERVPLVTFMLANQTPGGSRETYLGQIVQQHAGTPFFEAALAALQKKDYDSGNYQDVINRAARIESGDQHRAQNLAAPELHLLVAESAYYLRQYEQARSEYKLVLTSQDDNLTQKARLGEAWCLLQTGMLDSAALAFDQLRQRFSGEHLIRAAFGLGTTYFRLKQFEKAIANYPLEIGDLDSSALGPILTRSMYRVGDCYFRLGYFTQAIEMWHKLVEHHPHSDLAPHAQYKIAETYFLANHFEESIAAYTRIQEEYGQHPLAAESMLKTAQSRFNSGQYEQAIVDFEKFLQKYPGHGSSNDAFEGIQICYYQLGQTDKAAEALEKLIEQAPNAMLAADARFRLAESQLQAEQYQEAILSFKEILTSYPGSTYSRDAQFALAQAYYLSGNVNAANGEFTRFIQYFPQSPQVPEAVFKLAVGYFNDASYLTAVDYFTRIIQEFPETEFHEAALQNIGWCYQQLGEEEKARQYFEQYLQSFPASKENARVLLHLAKAKADAGDLQQAISSLKGLQAHEDSKIVAEASYHLGLFYLKLQELAAAKQAFKLASKTNSPDDYFRLSALSQLAALYETEHDWQKAVATYQRLMESTKEPSWLEACQERIQALTPMVAASTENNN